MEDMTDLHGGMQLFNAWLFVSRFSPSKVPWLAAQVCLSWTQKARTDVLATIFKDSEICQPRSKEIGEHREGEPKSGEKGQASC